MNTVRASATHLKDLEPYDPRYIPARIYLNANENPYGMPEQTRIDLQRAIKDEPLHRYPDPLAKRLRSALAERLGVTQECVLLGNGGDELLFNLCLAYGGKGRTMLTAPPTFTVYNTDALLTRTAVVEIARVEGMSPEKLLNTQVNEEAILERASVGDIDIIMLTSPNNPTGDCLSTDFIERLLACSDAVVLIDHAYIEFAHPKYDVSSWVQDHANLAVLRTFSKAYGLAGLRIGYMVSSEEITRELCKVRQPYSVDGLAALAALSALKQEVEVQSCVSAIQSERERLMQSLGIKGLGLPVAPSEANYLLFRVPGAHEVWQRLYDEYGILIRDLSQAPRLANCLRVSVGTPEENDEFINALGCILQTQEASNKK